MHLQDYQLSGHYRITDRPVTQNLDQFLSCIGMLHSGVSIACANCLRRTTGGICMSPSYVLTRKAPGRHTRTITQEHH